MTHIKKEKRYLLVRYLVSLLLIIVCTLLLLKHAQQDLPNLSATSEIKIEGKLTENQIINTITTSVKKSFSLPVFLNTNKSSEVFQNVIFYNWQNSGIQKIIANESSTTTLDTLLLKNISSQPIAIWLGPNNTGSSAQFQSIINDADANNQVPVFVLYYAARFECEKYTKEEDRYNNEYLAWIQGFADSVQNKKVIMILEPDALALTSCLFNQNLEDSLLSKAVSILKTNPNTYVYLDAGHSNWVTDFEMADRLIRSNISASDGFSLNISNFGFTNDNIQYGSKVSKLVSDKHFIIDTSRNGNGPSPENEWCNPRGRALGQHPTSETKHPLVDAFLWIKPPGESDGQCNGGPGEGIFWMDYALELVKNSLGQ